MTKKLTYEYVKKCFEDRGYKLLSKEYKTNHCKLKYECPEGHSGEISFASFQGERGCLECGRVSMIQKQRHDYEYIKKCFEDRGYTLLSKEYKGAHQKLKYVCPKGHKDEISFGHFQGEQGCSECGGSKKLTYEKVKKCFEGRGYELLSKEYKNAHHKLKYRCPGGHEEEISFNSFQRGGECPKCYRYEYDGEHYRSIQERECAKYLTEELKVPFEYDLSIIGQKKVDFFINDELFWEHHPDVKFHNDETTEEYTARRRKLLDENEYEDYPLIVTTSLDELGKIKAKLFLSILKSKVRAFIKSALRV